MRAAGRSPVIVRNSVMSGNTGHGIAAVSTGAPIVSVIVENTVAAHNGGAGATTIASNVIGISVMSLADVVSFGNNRIVANTTNGGPTTTIALE
jgi:hypothetical protein